MSRLSELQAAQTLRDFASILPMKASGLSYLLYQKDKKSKYTTFEIPKKSGGVRIIHAPTEDIKLAQRRLADLLQDCLDESEKNYRVSVKDERPERISHGFHRGRSIITNARQHRHRRYVFNVDLENFFGACNFGRVRGILIKSKQFMLSEKVATVIAHLACHEGSLPQGSPCSPVISNLIGRVLDIRLVRLAASVGCSYSRYADDLTFSTNEKQFPAEIAVPTVAGLGSWQAGPTLLNEIAGCGFVLNGTKTRMQVRNNRQTVTGLVVNSRINVTADYRHTVRAMVHSLLKTGAFTLKVSGEISPTLITGTLDQLQGMLGFIESVDEHHRKSRPSIVEVSDHATRDSAYRKFLLYRHFFAAQRPTIVCEGKTDNVYLTHAIRALATAFPKLASIGKDGAVKIQVRRFKYAGTNTGRMLNLFGGAGDLAKFVLTYRRVSKVFGAKGMEHPIIILVDNDSGPRQKLFPVVKDITKTAVTGKEEFVHVFGNLYLVATPLQAGKATSAIEDFFDPVTKGILVNGKSFDPDSEDGETTYGKAVFAYKVIEAAPDKVDFSGFHPLLERLDKVVAYHAARAIAPQ